MTPEEFENFLFYLKWVGVIAMCLIWIFIYTSDISSQQDKDHYRCNNKDYRCNNEHCYQCNSKDGFQHTHYRCCCDAPSQQITNQIHAENGCCGVCESEM